MLFPRRHSTTLTGYRDAPAVTIRWAGREDVTGVALLAELDAAAVPPAPVLLGFVGEKLWVAVSSRTGAVIADPFEPSAPVAALVRERARQLTVPEPAGRRRGVMGLRRRSRAGGGGLEIPAHAPRLG